MKPAKPRNHIALALMKRNGSGAHLKTQKAKRAEAKRQLTQELKKTSKYNLEVFLWLISIPSDI